MHASHPPPNQMFAITEVKGQNSKILSPQQERCSLRMGSLAPAKVPFFGWLGFVNIQSAVFELLVWVTPAEVLRRRLRAQIPLAGDANGVTPTCPIFRRTPVRDSIESS